MSGHQATPVHQLVEIQHVAPVQHSESIRQIQPIVHHVAPTVQNSVFSVQHAAPFQHYAPQSVQHVSPILQHIPPVLNLQHSNNYHIEESQDHQNYYVRYYIYF